MLINNALFVGSKKYSGFICFKAFAKDIFSYHVVYLVFLLGYTWYSTLSTGES